MNTPKVLALLLVVLFYVGGSATCCANSRADSQENDSSSFFLKFTQPLSATKLKELYQKLRDALPSVPVLRPLFGDTSNSENLLTCKDVTDRSYVLEIPHSKIFSAQDLYSLLVLDFPLETVDVIQTNYVIAKNPTNSSQDEELLWAEGVATSELLPHLRKAFKDRDYVTAVRLAKIILDRELPKSTPAQRTEAMNSLIESWIFLREDEQVIAKISEILENRGTYEKIIVLTPNYEIFLYDRLFDAFKRQLRSDEAQKKLSLFKETISVSPAWAKMNTASILKKYEDLVTELERAAEEHHNAREEAAALGLRFDTTNAARLAYNNKDSDQVIQLILPRWRNHSLSTRQSLEAYAQDVQWLLWAFEAKHHFRNWITFIYQTSATLEAAQKSLIQDPKKQVYIEYVEVLEKIKSSLLASLMRANNFSGLSYLPEQEFLNDTIVRFSGDSELGRQITEMRQALPKKKEFPGPDFLSWWTLPFANLLWGFFGGSEIVYVNQKFVPLLVDSTDPSRFAPLSTNMLAREYFRTDIHLQEAWEFLADRELAPIVVGVLDTGADLTHPSLVDALETEQDAADLGISHIMPACDHKKPECAYSDVFDLIRNKFNGFDFVNRKADPQDDENHGSHVAGIIGGRATSYGVFGVNPKARIMPIKVLNNLGTGSTEDVAKGLLYAVIARARVVNMSLGSFTRSSLLESILECSYQNGLITVAAASNTYEEDVYFPASYPNVVSTAASDSLGRKAFFSTYSPMVDISAPGESILSSIPLKKSGLHFNTKTLLLPLTKPEFPYAFFNGTSMATPVVTGAISLILSAFPEMSNDEVLGRIYSTASEPFELDPYLKSRMGKGLLNVAAALKAEATPVLRFTNSSEVQVFNISEHDRDSWKQNMHLKLKNFWKKATNVSLSFSVEKSFAEEVRLGTGSLEWPTIDQSQEIEFDVPVLFSRKFSKNYERIPVVSTFKWDGGESQELLQLETQPYFQMYPAELIGNLPKFSKPDPGQWSPSSLGWGIAGGFDSSGRFIAISKIFSPTPGVYFDSSTLRVSSFSNDEHLSPLESFEVKIWDGFYPQYVSQPVDLKNDGNLEVVANFRTETRLKLPNSLPLEPLPAGTYVFKSDGTRRAYSPQTSSKLVREDLSVHENGAIVTLEGRTQLVFHNSDLTEIARANVEYSNWAHVLLQCDVLGDEEAETLWITEHPKTFRTIISVFSATGSLLWESDKLFSEKGFPGDVLCVPNKSLPNVKQDIIVDFREKDKPLLGHLTRIHWNPVDDGQNPIQNRGQIRWAHAYETQTNYLPISLVDLNPELTAQGLFFRSSQTEFSILDVETGKLLSPFEKKTLYKPSQRNFIAYATSFYHAQSKQWALAVAEATGYLHFYSFSGTYLGMSALPGNYFRAPLRSPTQPSTLIWVGEKGIQKYD